MSALLLALVLQAAEPPVIAPGRVHHDTARGLFVMPPEDWTAEEAETGDGLVFTHPETGARIDVWAEPMGMSGVPGMPDHTLDALRLRLAAPGVAVGGVELKGPWDALELHGTDLDEGHGCGVRR
jgi:hypothetical protein